MSESLLSFSEVLLFGRALDDIKIESRTKVRAATTINLTTLEGGTVDGVTLRAGNRVLVKNQTDKTQNGVYTVADNAAKSWFNKIQFENGTVIKIRRGTQQKFWEQEGNFAVGEQEFTGSDKPPRGRGNNNHLAEQLDNDAQFARIYGFAYEGTYYELPEPTVFLVHGEGKTATMDNKPTDQAARAPGNPTLTGVASADYQIANDIRVWEYDKADYTIRMDVMTGQFEQVLLDIYFGFDSPAISGAKVSGAKVSGAKVSGAKVSGAKVSGAKVSGAKVRGGD
ncbi:hypothetical protein [Ruegeria atlantica]|uniref:Uncharacterized protein n=1 Tax=Ruegeria atlantica TaxID=81569 RepID=A0A0P1ECS5_9RHOB|nr:hypothetical protein [Ruegeria atlantica]CUH47487.1 hypothetical protein RUA4292_01658 [Ruegeria atlantica]